MNEVVLLNEKQIDLTLKRMAREVLENHPNFENAVLLGLQPRGVLFAERIKQEIQALLNKEISLGYLDTTFHRDDFRRRDEPIQPNKTQIDFVIEDKNVVLIDDVLYTGRSVRAGMDAMLSFGRPKAVELMVLIDRRLSRDLPIQANYIGCSVDSIQSQKVKVAWAEEQEADQVLLYTA